MKSAATLQQPKALGDIAEIVMGQSPPGSAVSRDSGIPLLNGPTEFGSHHPTPAQYTTDARKLAQPGDLLFCVRGSTTGRMNWADQDYAIGRGVAAIRHRHDPTLQPFIRGVIEVELPELLTQATGSTFPNVSARQLAEIPFPALCEAEQRAVAQILGTLDDKIELNRRMNQTLEEMARALFKSWFVDFDPVRAKIALKQHALGKPADPDPEPNWDGTAPATEWTIERARAYLDAMYPRIADLFPDRLVPSELGKIPEGWLASKLGNVIQIHDSKRIPLNSRQRADRHGPYPYYGAAGIMDYVDDFLFDGIYVLTGEDGSVVDDCDHPIVQYVWGQFWVNNHAHVLRGRNGVSEDHLYLLLKQVNIMPYVTGAVQPKLSQRNVKAVPIVYPDRSVCQVFSDIIAPLFESLRETTDEIEMLLSLRDALLPGLVLGEVRV